MKEIKKVILIRTINQLVNKLLFILTKKILFKSLLCDLAHFLYLLYFFFQYLVIDIYIPGQNK